MTVNKQTIAHEIWHCVEYDQFGPQALDAGHRIATHDWWIEVEPTSSAPLFIQTSRTSGFTFDGITLLGHCTSARMPHPCSRNGFTTTQMLSPRLLGCGNG